MSDKPISPLAVSAMIDDMTARRFGEDTPEGLRPAREELHGLSRPFAGYRYECEDLRRYQLHLAKSSRSVRGASTRRALRCGSFFKVTLERPDLVRHLAFPATAAAHGAGGAGARRSAAWRVSSDPRPASSTRRAALLCVAYGAEPAGVRGREPQGIRYR